MSINTSRAEMRYQETKTKQTCLKVDFVALKK